MQMELTDSLGLACLRASRRTAKGGAYEASNRLKADVTPCTQCCRQQLL